MSDDQEEFEFVSKTQLKRLAHEAQELGARLVDLPAKSLKQIELPEDLRDAVMQARDIKSHIARKRQIQYIGKLMRDIDTAPIANALARFDERHHGQVAEFHAVEHWRDRLLADTDQALSELIEAHPAIDIQHIRQLIRNSLREIKAQKPPKSKRQLFQYLKEFITE